MDIFLGSSQNWTIFRGHFYAFLGQFLRSWYRMGIFFGVAKISIFFIFFLGGGGGGGWVLEIPDIFGG